MKKKRARKGFDVISVLGGWIVRNTDGSWRTTTFEEKKSEYALGDRLRIEAAAMLYHSPRSKKSDIRIIVLGGKGYLPRSWKPPNVSTVMKKELIELGVPGSCIQEEAKSSSTYQQLSALSQIVAAWNDDVNICILSNRYHIPRIEAMVLFFSPLASLRALLDAKKLVCVSAEDILIKSDSIRWRGVIKRIYQNDFMKQRIDKELEGVKQIKEGAYAI